MKLQTPEIISIVKKAQLLSDFGSTCCEPLVRDSLPRNMKHNAERVPPQALGTVPSVASYRTAFAETCHWRRLRFRA
jgi:hypothetical protein